MDKNNKPSTAQVGHYYLNKLRQISAHTGLSGNRILENAIDSIYSGIIPLIAQTVETGDLIAYSMTINPFIKADLVSGTFAVPLNMPIEESNKIMDEKIQTQFAALDSEKEKRRLVAMFATSK